MVALKDFGQKLIAARGAKNPIERRRKSRLVCVGEEAMRTELLRTLQANGWNLSATATQLDMAGSGNVARAIRKLGLDENYRAARIAKIQSS